MKKQSRKYLAQMLIAVLSVQGIFVPLTSERMMIHAETAGKGDFVPSARKSSPSDVSADRGCASASDTEPVSDLETGWEDADLDWGYASASEAESLLEGSLNRVFSLGQSDELTAGDLWENWDGSTDFSGEGTPESPYAITCLEELMGLSEAVAAGRSYAGEYFELKQDIDLGNLNVNNGNWNPIGWHQNRAELSGDVAHTFQGHFDGAGCTISGLKITDLYENLSHVGLFGVIENGTIENLIVEGEDVYGNEDVGILTGELRGNCTVRNVTVSGLVYASEDAGGIAGEVTGAEKPAVIENCFADGITVYSSGTSGFAGGIAGNLQKAYLVDCTVITQDGDYNRIYGKGYVGGIAGRMNLAQIYNVYVNGTIGGNGSRAVGGIVGKYESGNMILARMAGDISRTNQGSASREGTFVGMRDSRDSFTYGTERTSNLSYLFTNSAAKAKQIFGSTWDGDNAYTKDAHIGYWTDQEKKYVTISGKVETSCGDRYFYEELEDGVRYIVTQKLNKDFTESGYGEKLGFYLDHFAPGYMGEPVRGYLVTIPRIDVRNKNGTVEADVAVMTAIPRSNSYYRTLDKDHVAAVASGEVITVLTAPKNTGEHRYQMVADETEQGGVIPPVFLNEEGDFLPMQYIAGGSYSFVMPECDTELNVQYERVTTQVLVSPAETEISIIHTRTGDRKVPKTMTEVKNQEGILIARYIDGELDQETEVQPVSIHAVCNGTGDTVDNTVKWSVDDRDLLENHSDTGYTSRDARVIPNVRSSFVQEILNREVKAQTDNRYREKINNTVYKRSAVVTAATNPETSADQVSVYGNCRINVTFQILDHTTVRVDGMKLSQENLEFTLTRRLTGKRSAPMETYEMTGPVVLHAQLYPERPFWKYVSWSDQKNEEMILLKPSGTDQQDCLLSLNYNPQREDNPAWIRNLILADREKAAQNPNALQTGSGSYETVITATSEDQTNGHITAECRVTVKFVTKDETYLRYSGGSGSSGGSSGGASGTSGSGTGGPGVSPSSVVSAGQSAAKSGSDSAAMLSYAVTGIWTKMEDGTWIFADKDRSYQNEWAAVFNPYANVDAGQNPCDWFRFDESGRMVTGWFIDADGRKYYLNPKSDGTLGAMLTGWQRIDEMDYYFNENSDGTKGSWIAEASADET